MNTELLYGSFSYLDDDLVARADAPRAAQPWKKYAALAACLALIVTAALTVPNFLRGDAPPPTSDDPAVIVPAETTPQPGQPEPALDPTPAPEYKLNWAAVEADELGDVAAAPRLQAYFMLYGESLTDAERAMLLPESLYSWMLPEVTALYYGWDELDSVEVRFASRQWDGVTTAVLSPADGTHARMLPYFCAPADAVEETQGCINDIPYTAREYRWADGEIVAAVTFTRGDVCYSITNAAAAADARQARRDAEDVALQYLTSREIPDLSLLRGHGNELFRNDELTWDEALSDPDFGAYFPTAAPDGFALEASSPIRRWRDARQDYLRGVWTKGYDELTWHVTRYDAGMAARLADVSDATDYDLSLYPIPRAESVPREKWEVVNDPIFRAEDLTDAVVAARAWTANEAGDNGVRMHFSVLYADDILVEITAKGVSPEWLYEQLISLH